LPEPIPTSVSFPVDHRARLDLIEILYVRYGRADGNSLAMRWKYWRKAYLWKLVVGGATAMKRLLDITISSIMLLLLTPLFLGVAIAIKLTDGGPVLFWQARVGQWGHEFPFPKFRSMVTNAESLKDKLLASNDHKEGVTFKMKKDPRVTWIGRIIRKASIDELPQLGCVLKGQMSLVGPRPPLPREVALYSLRDRRRLDVKPGLTCIWQVSGRGNIPFDQQVELDVLYIESQSVWLDIVLLLKTAPAILIGKGAY
jgi:lipopolysaccharide/colanic/teichoic acid biosynthesis glycosyltransferase